MPWAGKADVLEYQIKWLGEASLRRWHFSKHLKGVRSEAPGHLGTSVLCRRNGVPSMFSKVWAAGMQSRVSWER